MRSPRTTCRVDRALFGHINLVVTRSCALLLALTGSRITAPPDALDTARWYQHRGACRRHSRSSPTPRWARSAAR